MGSTIEKLNYLAETVDLLKAKISNMGEELPEDITTRELISALDKVVGDLDTRLLRESIVRYSNNDNDVFYHISDEIGEFDVIPSMLLENYIFIHPEIQVPDGSRISSMTLNSPSCTSKNSTKNVSYVSYKDVKGKNVSFNFFLMNIAPATLVLPETANLQNNVIYQGGSSITHNRRMFSRGLIFGKRVKYCFPNWLTYSLDSNKRVVKFPRNFEFKSGTLYLNKMSIKPECLKEMVLNLYPYTDGTTRKIKLCLDDYNELINMYINGEDCATFAFKKGWIIE